MRSLRSTTLTLLAAVLAMIALAWLIGWPPTTTGTTWTPASAIDRCLAGVNLAQLAIGVLGVRLISRGYATEMIRTTLLAVPRRLPVLWAKAGLCAAAVAFALMLASSFGAFLIGQHFLASAGTALSAPPMPGAPRLAGRPHRWRVHDSSEFVVDRARSRAAC